MATRPILKFLTFISASAIVGRAAAFIAVVVRPQLIAKRAPAAPAAQSARSLAPAATPVINQSETPAPPHAANSYADAVERAGPAVVNIYTARLVTERIQPSGIEELFGDARPRFRQRPQQSLG